MYFLFLLIFIAAIADQNFFRYGVVFNIGTNWRVMDVAILSVAVLVFLGYFVNRRTTIKGVHEKIVFLPLLIFIFLGIIAVVRGYSLVGTYAIGLGRYTLLDILMVPILLSVINSQRRLITFIKIIPYLIVAVWFFHFIAGFANINVQLKGTGEERFIDSDTALGLANLTMWIVPFAMGKSKTIKNHRIIVLFSLMMILFSQHRSVWIAMVAGLLSFCFIGYKTFGLRKYLFAVLLLGVITALFLFAINRFGSGELLNNIIFNRLAFLKGANNDVNGSWRVVGWLQVIHNVMRYNPLWGFGFSQAGWTTLNLEKVKVWEHSQYVHFFRAAGIIGLLFYLIFLGACIYYVLKVLPQKKGDVVQKILISVASALIMNIVYMFFYNQKIFLWIDIAMIIALTRISINEKEFEAEPEGRVRINSCDS